ncbi:LysR family transcriptional regulator [Streptomyces sp. NPDC059506]|uniref:LysR family transcriptional regulator n=1 Tax=unclassified Streptomyces TaxID=2593676 RepID=UPI000CCB7242|nr:LysR family transcriptional regulator [Streptomyces sp. SCUT-3]PLW72311.1 LysR family transcriptional regulator [Streptomyces sp. DJ]QMV21246.1 LysR family transcriptional regulator [Streptomyces sp. SCUT-3]
MELRHIAGFVAVAEELHFGRAAARLNMAQPPLSQQIRQLERELGQQLFERSTRTVRLTPAGEAFLEPARRVLADVEVARLAAQAGGRGEVGRVGIAFAGASTHEALPRLTRAVRAAHPGIELHLHGQLYSGEALAKVANGEIDLGFVRLPVRREGVSVRVVAHEQLLLALPADHRLAGSGAVDLRDMADEPFVTLPGTRGSAVRDALVHSCLSAGFTPRIAQEAPDTHTILALVGAGVGVTMTVSSVRHTAFDGVFRPVAGVPPQTLSMALAWRSDNPSAALRAVLAAAEQALPTPPDP